MDLFSLFFFCADPIEFKDEYEAVLMKPTLKKDTKPPLIVFPHGGPHVAFTSDFSLYSACLCKLGFSILNGKAINSLYLSLRCFLLTIIVPLPLLQSP